MSGDLDGLRWDFETSCSLSDRTFQALHQSIVKIEKLCRLGLMTVDLVNYWIIKDHNLKFEINFKIFVTSLEKRLNLFHEDYFWVMSKKSF